MKIALIPIDNRPVCYTLPKEIAGIDNELELIMPDRKLLGDLKSTADIDSISNWIETIPEVDAFIVSLDTIAYGGLISSRRSKKSIYEIKLNLEKIKSKLKGKIYAFSSIMRISNNNINEEEKEYWNEYGKKIFEYSYNFHKEGIDLTDVPKDILNDYLSTRQRNFTINKMYLEWLEQGVFDTLVFSKDDCSEFGFNVLESQILEKIILEKNLSAHIKTGADEIPLTLLARAVSDFYKTTPKISSKFLAPETICNNKNLISNYEDISIEKSVRAQIELAGGQIVDENEADMILLVNNFEENQGEIVMGINTKPFSEKLDFPQKPFMIADVRFANGADNKFMEKLLKKNLNSEFYGYSAWNTSANTLGSLICTGLIHFFAQDYNEEAFKKLQMVRFLDDWAYQANVRQILKKQAIVNGKQILRPDIRKLKKLMLPYEKKLSKIFDIKPQVNYKFPWKRFFEVEVIVK